MTEKSKNRSRFLSTLLQIPPLTFHQRSGSHNVSAPFLVQVVFQSGGLMWVLYWTSTDFLGFFLRQTGFSALFWSTNLLPYPALLFFFPSYLLLSSFFLMWGPSSFQRLRFALPPVQDQIGCQLSQALNSSKTYLLKNLFKLKPEIIVGRWGGGEKPLVV